ncbi:hypothetical protein LOK49_LG05G03034 [Camellia lanceoleosa]|uniref:Uncharacterized protein n=1 Tax=Camellia lanceoleosa TaxID=1840588 RepID=A0ACC0HK58_9ERIC|nr:hypothetical protein LOK49_LG05G03034 [Camellia lanceoleosa]
MSLNMKTLTQALAKAAAVIEKTVQTMVQEVTEPKPLQDYDLLDQIGFAGPGLVWKLYSAKAHSGSALSHQYPTASDPLLDKQSLSEARVRADLSKSVEDSFFDVVRADTARLVRLRAAVAVNIKNRNSNTNLELVLLYSRKLKGFVLKGMWLQTR